MDTRRREKLRVDDLGSKLGSIIVWVISISWGLFLIFNCSNIEKSIYKYQDGYYNSNFLVVDKYKRVNPFDELNPYRNILNLKDESGRLFVVSDVADSYFKTLNKGETISIGIPSSAILSKKRTPFQIWSALGSLLIAVLIAAFVVVLVETNKAKYLVEVNCLFAILYVVMSLIFACIF